MNAIDPSRRGNINILTITDRFTVVSSGQNECYMGTWKYSDFGEARAEVVTVAGKNQYNVHIVK